MTPREVKAFDEMFDIIFTAATSPESRLSHGRTLSPHVSIGKTYSPAHGLGELYSGIRGGKRLQWTSEADEELDRKKEEMDLCDTDQQLLEWAMREVFGESKRYEEEAKRAMENASTPRENLQLQPPSYPHLLATLMRTFREKYSDPHLSLSIFDYARHLSVPSYVFGCTTPAYNELIETRWKYFRDLRGVCDALEEMRFNGVEMDNRTRGLLEVIRSEVGARNLWEEESAIGSGEVWQMVSFIEKLLARLASRNAPKEKGGGAGTNQHKGKAWNKHQETWKASALSSSKGDDWEFGKWDEPFPPRQTGGDHYQPPAMSTIEDLDFADGEDFVDEMSEETTPWDEEKSS